MTWGGEQRKLWLWLGLGLAGEKKTGVWYPDDRGDPEKGEMRGEVSEEFCPADGG